MRNFGLQQKFLSAPLSGCDAETVRAIRPSSPQAVEGARTVLQLTSRPALRGERLTGSHAQITPREISFPPLPSGSIQAAGPPLECSDTTQTITDGFALFGAGLIALPIGFYLLFVL